MVKRFWIFMLILFGLLIFSRLVFLDSDTVAISNLHNEDEGNYVYNVRNFIVESTFFKDETNFILLSPLFSFFVFIFVKMFGISIFGFRFVSGFFAILCIVLGYTFLKKEKQKYALTFLLLLSTDFLFNIHSRIAMPEVTVSFFFFTTFVFFILAQKFNKQSLFFLTGFIAGLGFLVKANAVVIFGTCLSFIGIEILYNFVKSRKIEIELLLKNLYRIIFLFLGFLIPILFWNTFIIKPNIDKFELVRIGLIQLHRPYFRHVTSMPFIKTEIPKFAQGGEGFIWNYLALYFLIICAGTYFVLKTRKRINSKIFWFSFLWFLIGNMYYFIFWYKPARWYVPNIIPLILMTSFLSLYIPKKLRIFLIGVTISFNLFLNYTFIYKSPTYYLKTASKQIENIVGSNTYAGDSLVLMENKKSKAFNPYFIQDTYTKKTFTEFLDKTSYPNYIVVNKDHRIKEIRITNKYLMLQDSVKSNNLVEGQNRLLDIYTKK